MGRTVSLAPGYAPVDEFDPRIDDFTSKERKYLHFDLPLSEALREDCCFSKDEICHNSFWPLIGYTIEERRVKKDDQGALSFSLKERPIKFGSHRDAAIFEYYSKSLSLDYEVLLSGTGFAPSILAYRTGVGNNIDHSKSLFDEVRSRGTCTAIALDIKGFFDHISHASLYDAVCRVRGAVRLADIDFKLFRRMTAFEWVDHGALKNLLGSRYGRFGRMCTAKEFRNIVRAAKPKVISQNSHNFGIPQGTPLSGLYANIAMLDFDQCITQALNAQGASYRRYSDDIALVLPSGVDENVVISIVESELHKLGLKLSPLKTEISKFQKISGKQTASKPFQYLGFTFDGERTLVRQSSLNRYYSKMNRGVRAKIRAAKKNNVPSNEIFMRELFRRYTHFGRNKNFPRYVYRAAAVHQAPEMQRQIRRHMFVFRKMITGAIAAVYV